MPFCINKPSIKSRESQVNGSERQIGTAELQNGNAIFYSLLKSQKHSINIKNYTLSDIIINIKINIIMSVNMFIKT